MTYRLIIVASILSAVSMSAIADDGPMVPGVQSCAIDNGQGGLAIIPCPPEKVCCVAPVYAPCPSGQGVCLVGHPFECCDSALEGCHYQRRGNKIYVWCGGPFPPEE